MERKRIESKSEVETYIARLKYALENGARISFQIGRRVDDCRDIGFTNKSTVAALFPDESPETALRRELFSLTAAEYQCTVKDERFPKRSEMRVFGRTYHGNQDVYIKIRVELLDWNDFGRHTVFIMSFHFAEFGFDETDFPYRV